MALINYFTDQPQPTTQVLGSGMQQTTSAPPVATNTIDMVQGNLQALLGPGSDYIENARRRGIEQAATRGGVNSSIAAGAAERAALEAAAPLAQQAISIQADQNNLQMQNWLAEQNFGRTLFGQKFGSSLDMLNNINQMALMDPELYTPEVTSGLSNFFSQNMNNILKQYFNG